MPSAALANVPNAGYVYNLHYVDFGVRVSTADFIKNYGTLADRALAEPVTITKNGRDRLVVSAEDLTDQELGLIAEAKVPAEYGHLDAELENWKP